jgi:hypothetical protein
MAASRLVVELTIGNEDMTKLMAIARSRTEPASRVERARMLLAYRDGSSFFAVGRLLGVHHQPVQRCIEETKAWLTARPEGRFEFTFTPRHGSWVNLSLSACGEHPETPLPSRSLLM